MCITCWCCCAKCFPPFFAVKIIHLIFCSTIALFPTDFWTCCSVFNFDNWGSFYKSDTLAVIEITCKITIFINTSDCVCVCDTWLNICILKCIAFSIADTSPTCIFSLSVNTVTVSIFKGIPLDFNTAVNISKWRNFRRIQKNIACAIFVITACKIAFTVKTSYGISVFCFRLEFIIFKTGVGKPSATLLQQA